MSSNITPPIVHTPSMYFSAHQMADMMMNNLIAQKFSEVLKDNFTLSATNILKFIMLMSISEIKTWLTSLFPHLISFFKESPILMLSIYHKFKNRHIKQIENDICIIDNKSNNIITINADSNFMIALYNYINANKQCKFEKKINSVNINNMKEKILVIQLDNIIFENLFIKNKITYHINIYNNEPINAKISGIVVNNNVKSYLDILTHGQKDILIAVKEYYMCSYSIEAFVKSAKENAKDKITEYTIAKLMTQYYPQINIDETCYFIGIMNGLLSGKNNLLEDVITYLRNNNKMIYDLNNDYNETMLNGFNICHSMGINYAKGSSSGTRSNFSTKMYEEFGDLIKGIKNKIPGKENTNELQIHFSHDVDIQKTLEQFIADVYRYGKKQTCTIKINYLLLEDEIINEEYVNTEYEEWEEKKKMLDELKQQTKECPTINIMEFINKPIPPKKIINKTIKKKITFKYLNEIKKDLETLYLRKNDKEKLVNSLFQFKEKKEMLKELGLPNKLNILLYGLPGTGKSTTIQSVATYLGKDIYYVDLKEAKTNQDLQMMFEYVNKNVANGGIIVIEDIDAMIDIVHKRETKFNKSNFSQIPKDTITEIFAQSEMQCKNEMSKEYSVHEIMKNQDNKLTLEYLLNILQGTLTLDDSIFIVTTNYIDHLDPAFYRDGRFDVKMELKMCDHYQIQCIYQKILNKTISQEILNRIPEDMFTPASIIFHIKDYIFNADTNDEIILEKFLIKS